jgi:hypothetical protein
MYTRQYKDFRGVDFSSARAECAPTRFNDLVNMWRDYHSEQGAAVETAPGFRALFGVEGEVHSMHYLPGSGEKNKDGDEILCYYVIHAGEKLYVVEETEEKTEEETVKKYTPRTVLGERSDKRSQTVLFHNRLYFVDGQEYVCVDGNTVTRPSDGAYTPTTYLDGVPYEQKNMLTDRFWEIYTKPSYEGKHDGVEGYSFYSFHEILASFKDGTNSIDVVVRTAYGSEYGDIPPFVSQKSDPKYIHESAFGQRVSFKETAEDIDKPVYFSKNIVTGVAFDEENSTSKLFLYDSESKLFLGYLVEDGAFYEIRSNYGIRFVPEFVNNDQYGNKIDRIDTVFFGSSFKCVYEDPDTNQPSLVSHTFNKEDEVQLASNSEPNTYGSVGELQSVLTGNPDFPKGYSAAEAINGCTLITEFDGRVFLSGNPRLPNSVFYSQRDLTGYNNPFYIGCYNYLNDGTGKTPITAMITTPTQLIVLKDDVAQGAAIYYHYAQDNPSQDKVTADLQPRIYPRENGVPGVGCLGMACNFLDDPVFLSPKGLEAIGKSQVNLERTVTHRSSLVDARLCNEDLRRAVYAEWDGYLCILVPGGRMYLADSRQISEVSGSAQYEWYYLDDIGVYDGQKNRYHYVTGSTIETIGGKQVGHKPSGLYERTYVPDDATVQTTVVEGDTVGYVIEGEYAYIVESDGEQTGGTFKEATALLAVDGMLLFGCADGTVCMMNTDMRDDRGFISQDAYTHNGRGYESFCCLCSDTCGVENATKSTVSGSFVVKCKAFPETGVSVSVRTNEIEWEDVDRIVVGRVDLSRMSFLSFTFNTMRENTALVREKEKRWVEKQVAFHDHCYMSPFGLLSATYDYKIAGKVRMR